VELGLAPLRTMGIGMVLVIADFRFNGLDVVPDPLGWLAVVVGAFQLVAVDRVFRWAAVAAVLAVPLSLPDWVQPNEGLLAVVDTVVVTAFVFATCTGIARVCPPRRAAAAGLRWWDLGLTVVGLLLGQVADEVGVGAGWAPVVVLLAVAGLVVVVWFVVLLFKAAGEFPVPVTESR